MLRIAPVSDARLRVRQITINQSRAQPLLFVAGVDQVVRLRQSVWLWNCRFNSSWILALDVSQWRSMCGQEDRRGFCHAQNLYKVIVERKNILNEPQYSGVRAGRAGVGPRPLDAMSGLPKSV